MEGAVRKNKKSPFEKLFGTLVSEAHKIVIKPGETQPKETDTDELNSENNDGLISRAESEFRVYVLLTIVSFINSFFLMILITIITTKNQHQLTLLDVKIPLELKPLHLKGIFKNGTVFSSHFRKGTFTKARREFDLPADADNYFHFEYNGKHSYVHGYGNRDHFYQTSKTIHGKFLRRARYFTAKNFDSGKTVKSGFNSSIAQLGQNLMLFGGGRNFYTGM